MHCWLFFFTCVVFNSNKKQFLSLLPTACRRRSSSSLSPSSEEKKSHPKEAMPAPAPTKEEAKESAPASVSPFEPRGDAGKPEGRKTRGKEDQKKRGRSVSRPASRHRRRKRTDKSDKDKKEKKDKHKKRDKEKPSRKKPSSSSKEDVVEEPLRGKEAPPEPAKPPAGKQQKGNQKGAWRGRTKCPHCGARVADHPAAIEQHQQYSEYCLTWQMWSKMSTHAQRQSDSWYKAKMAARKIKIARDRAVREETGVHPSQSEREPSPCTEVSGRSGGGAPVQSVKSSPPRAMSARPQRKSPDKHEKKKRGKSSSSDSSVPGKKDQKKRGRQVVINISG